MQHPIHHPHSPFRIFAFSALATIAALTGVFIGRGAGGMIIALVLIAVEVAFSFDNAILNAKVLAKMSTFWQNMFLTVGAMIAVFGMRIVFPILIVSLTAGISWHAVLDMALHHPALYAEELEKAHPALSAFGGAFLLILAIDFFVDDEQEVMWLTRLERNFRKLATNWAPPLITALMVIIVALLPFNHHGKVTVVAGMAGILVYSAIHGLTEVFGRIQKRNMKTVKTATHVGMAALVSFLYLEVLDATFSFDSVLGAFAVTTDVILIAIGLGVGALWVRSLTIFMVRRGTLNNYKFIEHGAHYTIFALACILFLSIFTTVPELITGLVGISIIISSIIASRQAMTASKQSV
ncbi:MAG TPA: DUF475 domain-containing protein [Patescibacteria group bacterium]|nr:DUF475 domain-containing protein [Patescibacteria group bacterium]